MRMRVLTVVALGMIALLTLLAQASASPLAFMKVVAQKQGTLKGSGTEAPWVGMIPVDVVEQITASPRAPQSGLPTGQGVNKPLVIVKGCDAASPQLFQALCTNEVLTSITIEFVGAEHTGKAGVSSTLKVNNATVASFRQFVTHDNDPRGLRPGFVVEEVSFTFAKSSMTITSGGDAKTTDDTTSHSTRTEHRTGNGTKVKPKQ